MEIASECIDGADQPRKYLLNGLGYEEVYSRTILFVCRQRSGLLETHRASGEGLLSRFSVESRCGRVVDRTRDEVSRLIW